MAYSTVLCEIGLFYLHPVYKVLFGEQYLNLKRKNVAVAVKKFYNYGHLETEIDQDDSLADALKLNCNPGKTNLIM